MATALENAITTNASGPKQVSADGVTTQQHSLKEQIEADKYLASKSALSGNPLNGLVRMKIVPPGSV